MKKKYYFPALLFGCIASACAAQDEYFAGLKAGVSVPSLHGGDSGNDWNKNYTSRTGLYFGGFAEMPISKRFSLQPELVYAAEGGKRKGIQPFTIPSEYLAAFQMAFNTTNDYIYANLNSTSKINYLQLPVMLKYNLPLSKNGKWHAFAQAGPYVGYLIYAKQLVQADPLRVYVDGEGKTEIPQQYVVNFFGAKVDTLYPAKDQLKKINVGFQGALGVSRTLGPGKLFIEAGGNAGFITIQKGSDHGNNNIGAATVLVGYGLGIGKNQKKEPLN
ncbi:MAG: porin family protein [Edaphocola sp.]